MIKNNDTEIIALLKEYIRCIKVLSSVIYKSKSMDDSQMTSEQINEKIKQGVDEQLRKKVLEDEIETKREKENLLLNKKKVRKKEYTDDGQEIKIINIKHK